MRRLMPAHGTSRHFASTQHSVAFGAKRTLSDPRLPNWIYEYTPQEMLDSLSVRIGS